jgi:signal transduction histidine kinase
VSRSLPEWEQRCWQSLRRHIADGNEHSLHGAYELGRSALSEGVGVLDLSLALWRATLSLAGRSARNDQVLSTRLEGFMLECLSPYEMAQSGAREANSALRLIDERRDEQMRVISRELHDQAGQMLAVVHLGLDGLRPHLSPSGLSPLARVEALLQQVEEEIRRLSHELSPAILDDLGLVPALRKLGEGVARRGAIAVRVKGQTDGRLPQRIESALYRAVQEALTNVTRHAEATWAEVEVYRAENEIVCRVHDDGCGFDARAMLTRRHGRGIGLDGLRDRMQRLGGALEVGSAPGSGTVVMMRIPLEVSYEHASSNRR